MAVNILRLADRLRTEHDAYLLLEEMRWGEQQVCPHCSSIRKQFSVLTGTIFHGTKIPLRIWLLVIFDACSAKNGRVIADETRYGGKPRNRHGHDPKERVQRTGKDKATIMALVSRETGEVRSRVVPDIKGTTLRTAIAEQVDVPNTHLHTDALRTYQLIADSFASHGFVNHDDREYVRGDITTNHAETYFSQLKRSLDGTHHHVSREHLQRYLAEFDFRYTTCKLSDTERIDLLVSRVAGRRLTYRQPA
jgi:transposase-like protein